MSFQVDFIWINRDQKHFEWFVSLLTKLEMEQAEQEPGGEREAGTPQPPCSRCGAGGVSIPGNTQAASWRCTCT